MDLQDLDYKARQVTLVQLVQQGPVVLQGLGFEVQQVMLDRLGQLDQAAQAELR